MMTDDAKFYHKFETELQHLIINHSKGEYVKGIIHTNTIEGVWTIIKNGLRGQYHALSKKYLPFYLSEFAYKYNRRSKEDKVKAFEQTVEKAVGDDKCLVQYKPKEDVETLAYGESSWKEPSKKPNRKYRKLKAKKPRKKKRIFKKLVKGKRTKNIQTKFVKKRAIKKKPIKKRRIKKVRKAQPKIKSKKTAAKKKKRSR